MVDVNGTEHTADLIRLGRELKLPIIDNVIIAEDGYYSLAEHDELADLPQSQIMQAGLEMNANSFRRINRRRRVRRRFV